MVLAVTIIPVIRGKGERGREKGSKNKRKFGVRVGSHRKVQVITRKIFANY